MARKKITQILHDFRPGFPVLFWKLSLWAIAISSLVVPGAIYAGLIRIPTIPFLNGMAVQPKAKAQSATPWFANGITARPPVPRAVAANVIPYPFPKDPEKAGEMLKNPLPVTKETMQRGELVFDNYCQPCHGYKGLGDGSATGPGRVPSPPTLHSDKTRAWPDGRFFHVITVGQNTMPSYAKQIETMDRWAAVLFIRALHRSLTPKPGDLSPSQAGGAAPNAAGGNE